MRTIHKYSVLAASPFTVEMPRQAKFLAVQVQGTGGNPQMWFEVDTDRALEKRTFFVFGTGHGMPDHPLWHLGTFQLEDGALVFHLYERTES